MKNIKVGLKIDKEIVKRFSKDESKDKHTVLECGCIIEETDPRTIAPCKYHTENKGANGDPLYKYYKDTLLKGE